MTSQLIISLILGTAGFALIAVPSFFESQTHRQRLRRMTMQDEALENNENPWSPQVESSFDYVELAYIAAIFIGLLGLLFISLSSLFTDIKSVMGFGFLALYITLAICLIQKKSEAKRKEQEVLRYTPLVIEALCMLVESGQSILPAMDRIVKDFRPGNEVTNAFEKVYSLSSSGHTFSESINLVSAKCEHTVLKHTLLHLLSSQESGGELLPALKALADHAQQDWKVKNEIKIKQLENKVVFPVFVSVIGLMFMVAAVPLIPLFEIEDSFKPGSIASPEKPGETNEI